LFGLADGRFLLHNLQTNGTQMISGIHQQGDAIMGVFNFGGHILSVSQSGTILLWTDSTNKKDLTFEQEQITHCRAQESRKTPGLTEILVATQRGAVKTYNFNKPVLGQAGVINDYAFIHPGQYPVVADCGLTMINDISLAYVATGKGQLGIFSVN
jgi:hypothetical protein